MTAAPTHPFPPRRAGGLANRGSAGAQALTSAALLIPTIVIWYLRVRPYQADWQAFAPQLWSLALTLVLDGYFVAVVAVLARGPRARTSALITAGAATAVDLIASALPAFASYSEAVKWTDRILTVVGLVLFVAAWGLARRRRPAWTWGLAATVVVAILMSAMYASGWLFDTFGNSWIVFWAVWIGGFALCCAICWAFDQIGSAPGPPGPAEHYVSPTNSMAIAALASSLVLAPLAVLFGHIALRQIGRTGEDGRGLAIAGLVIGYVVTGLLIVYAVLVLFYFGMLISAIDG